MKIVATILLIVVTVCIILALAGVQPLSTWKDNAQTYFTNIFDGINDVVENKDVAKVKSISAGYGLHRSIYVELIPTDYAEANRNYTVELYEKGKLRDKTYVSWNQPELNVKKEALVSFRITSEELSAYYLENINGIFSVKIY